MVKAKLNKAFSVLWHSVNHLLWPCVCINCKAHIAETDDHLCNKCWEELLSCTSGFYCPTCGCDTTPYGLVNNRCPACHDREFHFDGLARVGIYRDALRDLTLGFKNDVCELDLLLGKLVTAALSGVGFTQHIDFFAPVPLHWIRRFNRGYNQSHLIAKRLRFKTTQINTDLVRIRNTKPQITSASISKRMRNVAGAFAVRKGHRFKDKTICLVDDIKTTGATLNECAKVLKEAGAVKVYAVVIAVAGQNQN